MERNIYLRPWGFYDILHTEAGTQIKRIHVQAGHRLSKQSHEHRSEHWLITAGKAQVEIEDNVFQLVKGDSVSIGVGEVHRIASASEEGCTFIEIQQGDYLGEDDIVRYDDDYGR
jgi:mannose-6-phosphate isomerase-like protein (cupin superfamily)